MSYMIIFICKSGSLPMNVFHINSYLIHVYQGIRNDAQSLKECKP